MFLKDLFFPRFCVGCGFVGSYLCLECEKKLKPFDNTRCLYCIKLSPFGLTHPACKKEGGIDGCLSLYLYNDILKKIIKQVKYRLATEIWNSFQLAVKPEVLSTLSFFRRLKRPFVIQPIPLHEEKMKERGFNQARLIALLFRKLLCYEFVDLLKRKKRTLPQAEIRGHSARYRNIRGAFSVSRETSVQGRHIILVDDVVTTGLTAREAARTLKRRGAAEVFVLSLAKG